MEDALEKPVLEVELANEPDDDLLVYLGLDGEEGRSAWEEFYSRHVGFIYGTLKKRWGSVLDRADIEDVVQDTFIRAHRLCHTYDAGKSDEDRPESHDRSRRAVRAWLGKIAENCLRDHLSRQDRWAANNLGELAETVPDSSGSSDPGPKTKAIAKALSGLSEREQDVIRTTMLFNKPGEEHQRLPDDVSRELARRLDTTNTNVRAIRSRAMKKLTERVNELLREEES